MRNTLLTIIAVIFGTFCAHAQNISFADPIVKAICVSNWDNNGDGELSETEAAAVTDLEDAFWDNDQITSFDELRFFTGLTSLDMTFSYCSNLTSINIPNSVTSIGYSAFSDCSGLTNISIPNSVTSIGEEAFGRCSSLESIVVSPDNEVYDSRDNCNAIIITATNTLIAGCQTTVIPNSVTSIGEWAFFGCSGLTGITIPNSVKSIGEWAFYDSGLMSINIPNSVDEVGKGAFYGCEGIKIIVEDIEAWCNIRHNEKEIDPILPPPILIPDPKPIGFNNLFFPSSWFLYHDANTQVTDLVIPDSMTEVPAYAFYNCASLNSVTIPNSVTSIGKEAFGGCTNLTSVHISSLTAWCNISFSNPISNAYHIYINGTEIKDLIVPDEITVIKGYAFSGCTSLNSVTIPNSVTIIGYEAFSSCTDLTAVTIPNSVTIIGDHAFSGCSGLTGITIPNSVNSIGEWAFYDSGLMSINIPNSVTSIGEEAFGGCSSLESIVVSPDNAIYDSRDNCNALIETETNCLIFGCKNTVIPNSVTGIGNEAFAKCTGLTSITIPSSITFIGSRSFMGCRDVKFIVKDLKAWCNIYFEDYLYFIESKWNYPQKRIAHVQKATQILVPSNPLESGFLYSDENTQVTDLVIPDGVTVIPNYAFYGCHGLKSITIPNSVKSIGWSAFHDHVSYFEDDAIVKNDDTTSITDIYSHIKTPFAIEYYDYECFSSAVQENATLHVPIGTRDIYAGTEGWMNFVHIVDDMPFNTLMAEDLTLSQGRSGKLMIELTNSDAINAVQFDLSLPEGLGIATDGEGSYVMETTGRSENLNISCERMEDGKYRILLYSMNRDTIAAGKGAVLKIKIACPEGFDTGTYDVIFSGIYLSRVVGDVSVNENEEDITAKLTVKETSAIRGDTDGDYAINITDVLVIIDYILGREITNFIYANSDLDRNGVVNITDAMIVVDIILGRTPAQIPASTRMNEFSLLRMSPSESACQIHTSTGSAVINAIQMDILLSEGCSLKKTSLMGRAARTHQLMTRHLDGNKYRMVVFSTKNVALDANAPLLNLETESGSGLLRTENILCTDDKSSSLQSHDLNAVVTGISSVHADTVDDAPVYNLHGQRLSKPQKGINIIKGHKVIR